MCFFSKIALPIFHRAYFPHYLLPFLSLSIGPFFFPKTRIFLKNKIPLFDLFFPSNPFPEKLFYSASTLVTNFVLNHFKFGVRINDFLRLKGKIMPQIFLKFLYSEDVKYTWIMNKNFHWWWGTLLPIEEMYFISRPFYQIVLSYMK